jgi:hypothetical protein
MPDFAHRVDDVVFSDCTRTICVKLVEDSLKHPVIQKLFHVQSGYQELSVIYLTVALIVYFVYYLINLVVRYSDVT